MILRRRLYAGLQCILRPIVDGPMATMDSRGYVQMSANTAMDNGRTILRSSRIYTDRRNVGCDDLHLSFDTVAYVVLVVPVCGAAGWKLLGKSDDIIRVQES